MNIFGKIQLKQSCCIIFLLIAFVTAANVQEAQDWERLFGEGNSFFIQDRYDEAIERYNAVLEAGYESGELYYNIGNAYYKKNEIGRAILCYERARRFLPDDDDLLNNIQLANVNIVDRISPVPDVFYVRYWKDFRKLLTADRWKALFIAAWMVTSLLVIVLFFSRKNTTRKLAKRFFVLLTLIVIIIGAAMMSSHLSDKPGVTAVVMEPTVSVYASPSETGTEIFIIHEGSVIYIKNVRGDWIEFRLADGKVGWILQKNVEVI